MARVKVPSYARKTAGQGLRERVFNKAGLTRTEAKKLGITSGVSRAHQLLKSKTISEEDAKRIAAFYDRFKNCKTPRCETAIKLWGGRRFGRKMAKRF